jgi:peptidoglycan hydrolase CwlO-like protein
LSDHLAGRNCPVLLFAALLVPAGGAVLVSAKGATTMTQADKMKPRTRADAEAEIAVINDLIEDLQGRIDDLKDEIEPLVEERDKIEEERDKIQEELDDLEDDDEQAEEDEAAA